LSFLSHITKNFIAHVMAEYDIAFGERLAEVAKSVIAEGISDLDAKRTVLYLSLLSAEISIKAMLEKAGKPVPAIRALSHRLADLLTELGHCEVEIEVSPNNRIYMPASRLRSCSFKHGNSEVTVGAVVDAENQGASTYPNQIRYGDVLTHYPPEVVAQMAAKVVDFAHQHWNNIRVK